MAVEQHSEDGHKTKEISSINGGKDYGSSLKNKNRDRKSSSSSKDKIRHSSSSKDKNNSSQKSSRDKDEDKENRDGKKEHKSLISSKDTNKDKEGSKHRHSSSSSNDKHSSSFKSQDKDKKSEKEQIVNNGEPELDQMKEEVKVESEEEDMILHISSENDSQNSQNNINASAASSCDYNLSQFKTEPEDSEDEVMPLSSRIKKRSIKRKFESDEEDEDIPLAARKKVKTEKTPKKIKIEDSDEDISLTARKKVKTEKTPKKLKTDDSGEDIKPAKKTKTKKEVKTETETTKRKKKKEEEEQEVWKWWEEEKKDDGIKWNFLEHKGPMFAPPYDPLPSNIKFLYDGKEVRLSQDAEEIASFYAKMLDHDYTTKDIFNKNFFKDWRKSMTDKERSIIVDLKKCNFKQMHAYYMDLAEKNRNRTKEEKLALKVKNEEILKEYGFCTIDGHKEKIGNFKIEPPGLFRGRGEHPKMGMLKKRVMPEDVLINCAKKSQIPQPPEGHKWKEVRHDSSVTWLASWTENVQNQVKYVMLNPSSKLKGEKDWQKYEIARTLDKSIEKIRKEYREHWKSKEMKIRQRAVALYFIDRLALRAGNEKDEDQADTVGCCSLRVEHIELHEQKDDKEYVVVFDFLGKDSIRYYNEVPVEKRVFKNLQLFMENKEPGDDLFDRLNTSIMNKHLNELMEGLSAKVFRTYNASWTLQQQLNELTNADATVAEKILSYNRANRAVAILCNHQRSVPKGHEKSMDKLKEKIEQKREQIADAQKQLNEAKRDAKKGSVKEKVVFDKKKKMLERLKDQLMRMEVQETDRDENKSIALGTSKLNYLDPRISVAWCKKYDVPIEKIYNKTQRDKFRWAIDMAGPDYVF